MFVLELGLIPQDRGANPMSEATIPGCSNMNNGTLIYAKSVQECFEIRL
jgi:hypothetical protein